MLFSCSVLFDSLRTVKMKTHESGGFCGWFLSVEHLEHFLDETKDLTKYEVSPL